MPHAVTLVGFFREEGGVEGKEVGVAGTVEVCFDKKGANASPPTPPPLKNSPYICNMCVRKPLWKVYWYCRMIDTAPFNMCTKAGYEIVRKDSMLSLLIQQRRKQMMCEKFPVFTSFQDSDMPDSDEELSHEEISPNDNLLSVQ